MSQPRLFHAENTTPRGDWVWVFASDQAARHSKGYAKIAKVNFGAMYGKPEGLAGRSYAIPVYGKAGPLPTEEILKSVACFCSYAHANPKIRFFVTRVTGGGLQQDDEDRIAQAFSAAPMNCSMPMAWATQLAHQSTTETAA